MKDKLLQFRLQSTDAEFEIPDGYYIVKTKITNDGVDVLVHLRQVENKNEQNSLPTG